MQNASTTPRNAPATDHEIRSLKSNVHRLLLRCEMKFRSAHSRGLDSSDHAEQQEDIQNLILAFEKFHVCDEPPSVRLVRFQTLQIGYGIIKCVVFSNQRKNGSQSFGGFLIMHFTDWQTLRTRQMVVPLSRKISTKSTRI